MFRMFGNNNQSEINDSLNKDQDCYSKCKDAQAILMDRAAYISISDSGEERDRYEDVNQQSDMHLRPVIDAAIKTMADCAATCPEFNPYETGNGPKSFR